MKPASIGVPLSQSSIWDLQRKYFQVRGIGAWSTGEVPQRVTSNRWIAQAYAQMVLGWLRDWHGEIASGQPLYVIELGCGNGRFGHGFLQYLLHPPGPVHRQIDIRYIYTDLTRDNLDFLRLHLSLRPFVITGQVDFARLDVEADAELHLIESGLRLDAATVKNPVVVIANYVFDGIRQDCFRITAGEMQETRVWQAQEQDLAEAGPAEQLSALELAYDHYSFTGPYYEEPAWNSILETYRHLGEGYLSFPCGALQAISNLRRLFPGRLLLLSGDKGHIHEPTVLEPAFPELDIHGSFSMMVNYDAVSKYVEHCGGRCLRTSRLISPLQVVACLFGEPRGGYHETLLAYDEAIEQRGPDDFFCLVKSLEPRCEQLSLEQLIAYVRFSGWDHAVFLDCFSAFLRHAPAASEVDRADLRQMVERIWQTYFPLREPLDVAFHLGALLVEIGCPQDALEYFQFSLELYGRHATTLMNMAMCHARLEQWKEALERISQALEMEGNAETIQELHTQVLAAMEESKRKRR